MSIPEQANPARAEQRRILAAVRASQLPHDARLIMSAASAEATESATAGWPFAISLDVIADRTRLTHRDVADHVAGLIQAGWIARINGRWQLAVPAPEPPA